MATVSVAFLAQSCFTGIETTPKISAGDVMKVTAQQAPEETYLANIKPEPFDRWKPGKQFYVTDNRINVIFSTDTLTGKQMKGTVFSFVDFNPVTSITGKSETHIRFKSTDGKILTYRSPLSTTELSRRVDPTPPFLIDISMIDSARSLLKGKELFVISSMWRDHDDNSLKGRKFVPVKVLDVSAGTTQYPLCIDFREIDTGNDQSKGSLFVNPQSDSKGARTFQSQFSLTDPKLNYPLIPDEHWELISNGIVAAGMTREECRLALGPPIDLDRQAGYSSVIERWTYENGVFLVFNDGLLTDFRR